MAIVEFNCQPLALADLFALSKVELKSTFQTYFLNGLNNPDPP